MANTFFDTNFLSQTVKFIKMLIDMYLVPIQPDVVKVKLTKSIVDKNQIKLIISGVETFSIH